MNLITRTSFLALVGLLSLTASLARAQTVETPPSAAFSTPEPIVDILVRGNGKVEADAIVTMLRTRKGDVLDPKTLREDIKTLYELGYFRTVRVLRASAPGGMKLIIQVEEKPAIIGIKFEGLEDVEDTEFREKLETKLYTIVNEAIITNDLRMIEKHYIEKGYYLARATYSLDTASSGNEVTLIFHVAEGGKVMVGDVYLLGNKFFTVGDLVSKMAMQPYSRSAAYSSSSLFQDDYLKRDLEMMSYFYRDSGFMEIKIAKPVTQLDSDREFVRLTYQVEEGIQYYLDSIDLEGDLLFPKKELLEAMKLKSGGVFRQSQFNADMEMLIDKYGDLGYAFVDVQPVPTFNRETHKASLVYQITKGDKIYFGEMLVVSDSNKTRDNVLRRDFEVTDAELYKTTGLSETRKNIDRLGFFEEVQVLRERSEQEQTMLNLKFKVKEKPTGMLNASLGFSPGQGTTESSWTFQGSFSEQNLFGRAYYSQIKANWNGERTYSLDLDFSNPRVNDSLWSTSLNLFYRNSVQAILDDVEMQDKRIGASLGVGRKIIELIRGTITYKITRIQQTSDKFVLDRYMIDDAIASSVIFGLSRVSVNNYIDPSDGSRIGLSHQITGGPVLGGTQRFQESSGYATVFYPIDFTETFRTYFRWHNLVSYVFPQDDNIPVPISERYKLGGYDDMRGFMWSSIGPHVNLLRAPGGYPTRYNKGGDKKILSQLEYFVPLIPEAGIKAIFFTDWGQVFDDSQALSLENLYRDAGFGFRWITPIAPFRFEWAYPWVDGHFGEGRPIFSIGY
jgi:outer membrane protein insertion porin family